MIIKHKSKKFGDRLATPDNIYLMCCAIWGLAKCTLDVCADFNNTKCSRFFDEKTDSLSKNCNWLRFDGEKSIIWCNPPHSKTKEFVIKAYDQWKRFDTDIIMLIPINCMTSNYFKEYALPFIQFDRKMILSRIRFLDPRTNKPSKYNSVNGYVTIYFKSSERK